MLSPNEIKAKTFATARNGYDQNEVNSFLAELAKTVSELTAANEDSEAKIIKLVEKINEYREDEEAIKNAMIMAQKESAKLVSDAKEQARDMIESAKSEQVRLAEQSASECEKIIREHKENCAKVLKENTDITEKEITKIRASLAAEKAAYENLQKEVTLFKSNLVGLYNQQLHLIMDIPTVELPEEEQAAEADAKAEESAEEAAAEAAAEEKKETEREHMDRVLNTGSFEPVIPKENLTDLKFGKNN